MSSIVVNSFVTIILLLSLKEFQCYSGYIRMSTERRGSYDSNKRYKPSEKKFGGAASRRTGDSWKVLTTKLDSTKSAKSKFGKMEIKSEDDNRTDELQCKHFSKCSGCSVKGDFTNTPVVRMAERFFLTENVKIDLHLGNHTQWRSHAKLAVQPLSKWGGLKIGLYKSGSHEVEEIPECQVHHPRINQAVEVLKKLATDVGVKGYVEPKNGLKAQGELRYIQLTVDRSTQKVQLVLVWNAENYKDAGPALPRLVKKLKSNVDLWHSISINFQQSTGNAIFNYNAKAWKVLWGPPILKETVGVANFYFTPQIFRQANLDQFETGIIPLINKNVPEGSTVSELYSGIGIVGLNVANKADVVFCSDSNEFVHEVFDKSADSLPEEDKDKVYFESFSAEDAIEEGQCENAQVLIVDPPRKGLDPVVINLLTDSHPTSQSPSLKRLIYVSCGYEALEKDTRTLLSSGKWKIKSADGFLLFPGSDHIETVVVFDKTK